MTAAPIASATGPLATSTGPQDPQGKSRGQTMIENTESTKTTNQEGLEKSSKKEREEILHRDMSSNQKVLSLISETSKHKPEITKVDSADSVTHRRVLPRWWSPRTRKKLTNRKTISKRKLESLVWAINPLDSSNFRKQPSKLKIQSLFSILSWEQQPIKITFTSLVSHQDSESTKTNGETPLSKK